MNIFQEAEYPGNKAELSQKATITTHKMMKNQMESAIILQTINAQQQSEKHVPGQEFGGSKQAHSTENSDSEKEIQTATNEAQMSIVTATPNNECWRKVEKKVGNNR